MLRRSLFLMALACAVSPAFAADPSPTQEADPSPTQEVDPSPNSAALHPMPAPTTDAFIARVAAGSLFEVESSRLARGKSHSTDVRAFADREVADHARAEDSFDKTVAEAKVTAPPRQMTPAQRSIVWDLGKKEATAFDEQYVQAQYNVHVEAVEMFRAYAGGGDNPRLRQFARDLLPTLEQHLAELQALRK